MLSYFKELNQKEFHFDPITKVQLYLLIFTVGGFFGFLYEELFYLIDLGYLTKRGTTLGPWIPIYGFGAIFILFGTLRLKKRPLVVFLLAALISGLLEFATGYVLYHAAGIRLWDYNVEIWNWGNIGGYVCFRSVLFFGVSALVLVYLAYPLLALLAEKSKPKTFRLIACIPSALFIADVLGVVIRAL